MRGLLVGGRAPDETMYGSVRPRADLHGSRFVMVPKPRNRHSHSIIADILKCAPNLGAIAAAGFNLN